MNDALVSELVEDYRRHHARDVERASVAEIRAALRELRARMAAAAECLDAFPSSATANQRTARHDAAALVGATASESGRSATDLAKTAIAALLELDVYADGALDRLTADRHYGAAARMTAARIWAQADALGIRASTTANGPAVQLLVAIAGAAGDQTLTPAAARKVLIETRPK